MSLLKDIEKTYKLNIKTNVTRYIKKSLLIICTIICSLINNIEYIHPNSSIIPNRFSIINFLNILISNVFICSFFKNIIFNNEEDLITYVKAIQANSKIDSNAIAMPSEMPGYDDKIIMASGSFTQGSSIELSCDGPLRSPYIAYQQGSISYKYGKIIVERAINSLINK